jgi:hypothetical protein
MRFTRQIQTGGRSTALLRLSPRTPMKITQKEHGFTKQRRELEGCEQQSDRVMT